MIESFRLATIQCPQINGIQIGMVEHKICLYADDITFFLQAPLQTSLSALKKIITAFSFASGYKINEQKPVFVDFGMSRAS